MFHFLQTSIFPKYAMLIDFSHLYFNYSMETNCASLYTNNKKHFSLPIVINPISCAQ